MKWSGRCMEVTEPIWPTCSGTAQDISDLQFRDSCAHKNNYFVFINNNLSHALEHHCGLRNQHLLNIYLLHNLRLVWAVTALTSRLFISSVSCCSLCRSFYSFKYLFSNRILFSLLFLRYYPLLFLPYLTLPYLALPSLTFSPGFLPYPIYWLSFSQPCHIYYSSFYSPSSLFSLSFSHLLLLDPYFHFTSLLISSHLISPAVSSFFTSPHLSFLLISSLLPY